MFHKLCISFIKFELLILNFLSINYLVFRFFKTFFVILIKSLIFNPHSISAFGFCEYGDPESALRAMRLLHDYELGEKKLVVCKY